jgi:spectinomycin phosphotransferase
MSDPVETGLAEAIAAGYGIELVRITHLRGGLDSSASVHKASTRGGTEFVVKVASRLPVGTSLSLALADAGIPEVLAPRLTLKGEAALSFKRRMVLLFPFIDGVNGFERQLLFEQWGRVGKALVQVHRFELPPDLAASMGVEDFRVHGKEEFREIAQRLSVDQGLSSEERGIRDAISAHSSRIEMVLQRTRELGEACRDREWPLVPCHADLHAGNILALPGGDVHLIDWDAPRRAPRECDLVFFLGGGITGDGGEMEEGFCEGYGECTPDLLPLTYYRFARAMEDIVSFAREAVDPDQPDRARKAEALRFFSAIFGPEMIVETAMQSDRELEAQKR